MKKYKLTRTETTDQGTFGKLEIDGTIFATAELPWEDNIRQTSCIPAGTYIVKPNVSPKFGECYKVLDVPSRSEILLHTGNYAGDESKGYASDVEGCILIGKKHGILNEQKVVLDSKNAFTELKKLIGKHSFVLEIIDLHTNLQ